LDATNGLLTNFTGRVALTSTVGVSIDPAISGDFVQGEWTGSVTVTQAASGAVLVAADDLGHFGYANPINVISLPSLSVQRSGSSLLLSWSAAGPTFVLESSSDLISWTTLSTPIQLSSSIYTARVNCSGTNSFYRLHYGAP
jgi:hypothetical protein